MKMFCQECGHPLNDEDVVCIACGAKIIQIQKASRNQIISIEAEALVKLVDREGKRSIEDYFSIQPHGKFLGIFQKHKVEMIDQYAYFEGPLEPLTFQFNKKVVKEEDRGDNFVLFGPLSPGIYDVETKFENEFGTDSTASETYLSSYEGDHSWITVDLTISEVMFEIDNYSAPAMKKVSVIVNEVEIPVDVDGMTESVGPFLLDGSQKAKIVVEYPWGEVASEDMMIESEHQYLTAMVFTKEQETEVAKLLLQFGEELAKAKATKSINVFTAITDKNKEIIYEQMLDYYINNEMYYSGQMEQMSMDADVVELLEDSPSLYVNAELLYKEANYSLTDIPEFESQLYSYVFELTYDEQQKKWFINSEENWGYVESPTHVLKGSGVVHSPNSESLHAAKVDVVKEELQAFMENFVYSSVLAINYQSISYVENLMTKDGPRLKESADYITYLADKGITEELISTQVEKVVEKDSNSWEVTSIEEYKIFYPDKELQKKYKTVSLVKKVDGNWLIHELISTEEF